MFYDRHVVDLVVPFPHKALWSKNTSYYGLEGQRPLQGEGDELINSLTDAARYAKTFVEDCILAKAVIRMNLRFSNFILEGNFIALMIAIVRIVKASE